MYVVLTKLNVWDWRSVDAMAHRREEVAAGCRHGKGGVWEGVVVEGVAIVAAPTTRAEKRERAAKAPAMKGRGGVGNPS